MASQGVDIDSAYGWLEQMVDPPKFTINWDALLSDVK
jgi:hypothetical protein